MDEGIENEDHSSTETGEISGAARTVTLAARTELSINELETHDDLFPAARDFDLHLHPARTRHHHILDIARAALGQGATVTTEVFLDQVGDSFALLRYPELNFLAVPEDIYLPRAAIDLYRLRSG